VNFFSVLYISIHRQTESFYAASDSSVYNFVGDNDAKGFTINIPWNSNDVSDAEYISAFIKIVIPVSFQFDPDLVLISAGFDAAVNDPLGGCKVSPIGYAHMLKMLLQLANGNVILALEGGYNIETTSDCMSACIAVLNGEDVPNLSPIVPKTR
jgi:histone deacetylase 6